MRKRLWFIDDDADVLLTMAEIFNSRYEIEAFANGEDLLRALAQRKPNVIVSDFRMPGMNGLELADRLNKLGCSTPLILATGFADKSVYSSAMGRQIFKVVEKPFSTKELMKIVDEAAEADVFNSITRDLRQTAEEFFSVAYSAMNAYRERAEDAERLLRELGLLSNSRETQLARFVKTSELETKAEELNAKLQALSNLDRVEAAPEEKVNPGKIGFAA